jgi:hypothetical protein
MTIPPALALFQDTMRVGQASFNRALTFSSAQVLALVEPLGTTPAVRARHQKATKDALDRSQLPTALNYCKMVVPSQKIGPAATLNRAMRYLSIAGFASSLDDFWQLRDDDDEEVVPRTSQYTAFAGLPLKKPNACFCNKLFNIEEQGSLAERWLHRNHGYFNKTTWQIIQACPGAVGMLRARQPKTKPFADFLLGSPNQEWFGLTPV